MRSEAQAVNMAAEIKILTEQMSQVKHTFAWSGLIRVLKTVGSYYDVLLLVPGW